MSANDIDGCFGDVEVLSEKFDESTISLAIMRLGAKINSELIWGDFEYFFLRTAGFYRYKIFCHISVLYHTYVKNASCAVGRVSWSWYNDRYG